MDALWPFIHQRREVSDGMKNATDNSALEIVLQILHLARDEWLWLQGFPCMRMLREPKRRIRILNRAESERLLEALPAHLFPRDPVRTGNRMSDVGCRMSEILHLEWRRVDFSRQVTWLDPGTTKTSEGRGIPLNRDAFLSLRAVQGENQKWCFTWQGKRMETIGSAWKYERRSTNSVFTIYDTPGRAGM